MSAPKIQFFVWFTNVRDIPWRNVDSNGHTQPTQAFVEIIGKTPTKTSTGIQSNILLGQSLYFLVPYHPYFYLNLPYEWTKEKCVEFVQKLKSIRNIPPLKGIDLFWRNRQPVHTCLSTQMCTVLKFTFDNLANQKAFANFVIGLDSTFPDLVPFSPRIWETPLTVPDTLKVAMTSEIKPSVWLHVPVDVCRCMNATFTKHCDEWFVPFLDKFQICTDPAPELSLTICSFDLECYSHSGGFPNANLDSDPIITIGNSIQTITNGKITHSRNIVFCLNEVERSADFKPPSGESEVSMEVRWFHTEREMILAWRKCIFDEIDPDILTGYNIYQFDLPYLATRAKRILHLPSDQDFFSLGRKLNDFSRFEEQKIQQDEKKDETKKKKEFKVLIQSPVQMFGRIILDMVIWIRKLPTKFKNYKLETVASTLMNKHKVDIKPWQIFAFYKESKYRRYEVARYCIVDCELIIEMIVHQNVCTRELAMSRNTCTNLVKVISCGQQMKCFNMIMCFGYRKKYVCNYTAPSKSVQSWLYPKWRQNEHTARGWNDHNWDKDDVDQPDEQLKKFQGATVIEPRVGYYRGCVIVLDFASKYPTEMRSHNLCSSTFIGDETMTLVLEPWLKDRPQDEWTQTNDIVFDEKSSFRTFWKLHQDKRFVNPMDAWHELRPNIQKVVNGPKEWSYFTTSFVGLTSEVIAYLFAERKKLKAQMKTAKQNNDKLAESIADADQGAVKVIMNSTYGMFGSSPETARLPCRRVSMSVTSIGREEIEMLERVTKETFGTTVIYGDTDSIFLSIHNKEQKEKTMSIEDEVRAAFQLGEKIAHHITHVTFQQKASLELDKVFQPFIITTKKKTYNGAKYEPQKDANGQFVVKKPTQGATGTISNKRDFCDVHKEIFETMIHYMIMESNVKKAYTHLVFSLERIVNNWYPIDKFTCRNQLGHKNNVAIKAVVIRNKIRERVPGSEPKSGDIVSFVYIRLNKKKAKVMEQIEDIDYVQEKGLPLDLKHYIDLLKTQITPYFDCFPSLHVPELFDKASELSLASGSQFTSNFFQVRKQQPSLYEHAVEQFLMKHLREHLHFSNECIQLILQIWKTYFVWNAIPNTYHRINVTPECLWRESAQMMEKFASVSTSFPSVSTSFPSVSTPTSKLPVLFAPISAPSKPVSKKRKSTEELG